MNQYFESYLLELPKKIVERVQMVNNRLESQIEKCLETARKEAEDMLPDFLAKAEEKAEFLVERKLHDFENKVVNRKMRDLKQSITDENALKLENRMTDLTNVRGLIGIDCKYRSLKDYLLSFPLDVEKRFLDTELTLERAVIKTGSIVSETQK